MAVATAGVGMMASKWARPLLIAMLLIAFALRLYRLDYQELRGDEVFGYFFSVRPLAELVPATLELREPHPIASYALQHEWLQWLGDSGPGHSEFALRFPSAWFGLLSVALLYALGRQLLPVSAVLCATVFLAVSPYAIWHSQDARMYSMSLAMTTASTWLMVLWLQRQRSNLAVAYVVITLLALHTHYFAVFVLVAQNLFILLRAVGASRLRSIFGDGTGHLEENTRHLHPLFSLVPRNWDVSFVNWLILQMTVAFFYGPWLLRVQHILGNYGGNGDSPDLLSMLRRGVSVFAVGESIPASQRVWWAWVALLLLFAGAIVLWQRGVTGRRALLLAGLYLAVPLLATWWSAQTRPIFNERYLVAALPGFYLLIGAVVGQCCARFGQGVGAQYTYRSLINRLLPLSITTVYVVGLLLSLQRHYADPAYSKTRGWRELAVALQHWSNGLPVDDVRIAQNFPDPTLWYYYRGPVEHIVLPPQPHDDAGARSTVASLLESGVQRVLLPRQPAPNWDDHHLAEDALAIGYLPLSEKQVGVWPLLLYQQPFAAVRPLSVLFQNGVQLTGFAHSPDGLTPDNVLIVALTWRGDGAVAGQLSVTDTKVFVQLLDEQGQLVAQSDRPLLPDALSTHQQSYYDILLPTSLAPGSYRLITGLYETATARSPRIVTTKGEELIELTVLTTEGR